MPKFYSSKSNAQKAARKLDVARVVEVEGKWAVITPEEDAATADDEAPPKQINESPALVVALPETAERDKDGFYVTYAGVRIGPYITAKVALAQKPADLRAELAKLLNTAPAGVVLAKAAKASKVAAAKKPIERASKAKDGALNPKHQTVVDALRKSGATLAQIATMTGWTTSSSRNFVVWLGKRHGMAVAAATGKDKASTVYSLPAA